MVPFITDPGLEQRRQEAMDARNGPDKAELLLLLMGAQERILEGEYSGACDRLKTAAGLLEPHCR